MVRALIRSAPCTERDVRGEERETEHHQRATEDLPSPGQQPAGKVGPRKEQCQHRLMDRHRTAQFFGYRIRGRFIKTTNTVKATAQTRAIQRTD